MRCALTECFLHVLHDVHRGAGRHHDAARRVDDLADDVHCMYRHAAANAHDDVRGLVQRGGVTLLRQQAAQILRESGEHDMDSGQRAGRRSGALYADSLVRGWGWRPSAGLQRRVCRAARGAVAVPPGAGLSRSRRQHRLPLPERRWNSRELQSAGRGSCRALSSASLPARCRALFYAKSMLRTGLGRRLRGRFPSMDRWPSG